MYICPWANLNIIDTSVCPHFCSMITASIAVPYFWGTHTHIHARTHTGPILLPWPLTREVKMLYLHHILDIRNESNQKRIPIKWQSDFRHHTININCLWEKELSMSFRGLRKNEDLFVMLLLHRVENISFPDNVTTSMAIYFYVLVPGIYD